MFKTKPAGSKRFSRRSAVIATFALVASVSIVPVFAASPAAATYAVSTTGSDSNACTTAAPCKTIAHAFSTVPAGSTVAVAAGEYGSQSVNGTKAAPGVVFQLAAGAHLTNLGIEATYAEFDGGVIDGYGWWRDAVNPVPAHITMRNVTAKTFTANGGDSISIIGGSIGGITQAAGEAGVIFIEGNINPLTNVLIDGVDVHDASHANAADHYEAVRIDAGVSNLTIRNSKFRNITANTSIVFITNVFGDPGDPHDITFANNMFAAPESGPGGGAYYAITAQSPVIQACTNFAFLNNSFAVSPATLPCATKSGVSWIGNVGPKASGVCQGNTFDHNVWQSALASSACSSTDKVVIGTEYSVDKLGFTNASTGDLRLVAGSPAAGEGATATTGTGTPTPTTTVPVTAPPTTAAPATTTTTKAPAPTTSTTVKAPTTTVPVTAAPTTSTTVVAPPVSTPTPIPTTTIPKTTSTTTPHTTTSVKRTPPTTTAPRHGDGGNHNNNNNHKKKHWWCFWR